MQEGPTPVQESTPLIPEAPETTEPRERKGILEAVKGVTAEDVKRKADDAWIKLTRGLTHTRRRMKESPWILSLIIGIASLAVVWAGLFDIVSYVFRLRPIKTVIKVYQVIFGLVCLIVEAARYFAFFNVRTFIHRWLPFMELSFGRGFLQALTAGLAIGDEWLAPQTLFALALGAAGVFNIVWGVSCFLKLQSIFTQLKKEMAETTAAGEGGPQMNLLLIQRKFAALDLNGDGRLSREELAAGCRSLNIPMEDEDIDTIFSLLDPKGKGYIDITDFEAWWYAQKGPLGLIV